jgi:hypothetical protein
MNVRLKTGRYWVKLIFFELASRYHFCELSDVYRSVNFDSKYLNSRRSHSGTTVAYARVCISGQQFNPEILSGGEKIGRFGPAAKIQTQTQIRFEVY